MARTSLYWFRGTFWAWTGTVLFWFYTLFARAAVPAPASIPGESLDGIRHFDVMEYRVEGTKSLPKIDIESAVYPYLGPYRTADDVEKARAALEKAYRDKGYQAVSVAIPPQKVEGGVITLQVAEGKVGRLRVHGAKYYSPAKIKRQAVALQEGTVLEFKSVSQDIVALNQNPDRRVTPSLKPGFTPGTVDVDLEVEDKFPIHGDLEFNNRYSAGTTHYRINGGVSYGNLWQLGHTIGMNFQIAPEDIEEVKVFSGFYQMPVPSVDWLSLMLSGTKQDSNVSTLGGSAAQGRGETIGPRAIIALPGESATGRTFFQSLSTGFDYKHFDQTLILGEDETNSPITYYPISAAYSAGWLGKGSDTLLNTTVTLHVRGMGSSSSEFDERRFKASGNFIYIRTDLSHTHDLPEDCQVWGKMQGQLASGPLLDGEQFSGGGLGTVRGYLEGEAAGDNALFGSVELRSPSLGTWIGKAVDEWRFYLFSDTGILIVNEALPEQDSNFGLASFGVGSRLRLKEHFNGSFDFGAPILDGPNTTAYKPRLTFRLWLDF